MGQGSGVAVSCAVGPRRGSDPKFLWLWRRPEATAPIRPLAWETSICHGCGLKNRKKKTEKKKKKCYFKKINKIDISLMRLIRKKRQDRNYPYLEERDISTDPTNSKKTIKRYFGDLYANKFVNLYKNGQIIRETTTNSQSSLKIK